MTVDGDPRERAKAAFEHDFNTVELDQSTMSRIDFYGDAWYEAVRTTDRLEGLRKTVTVRGWYISTLPNFEDRGNRPDFVFEINGQSMNEDNHSRPWHWQFWVNKETLNQHTKLNSAVVSARMRS